MVVLASSGHKPKPLDGIDYPDKGLVNQPLFIQGHRAWIHDPESKKKVELDTRHLKPIPAKPGHWVYVGKGVHEKQIKAFEVTINIHGGVDVLKVNTTSPASAKARAVSKTAQKLGTNERHVYMLLSTPPNSLSIKEIS